MALGTQEGLGPASGASRERAGRRGFCPGPWSRSCAQGLGNGGGSRSVGSQPAPGPGFGEGGPGPTLGSALSSPSSDLQAVLTHPPTTAFSFYPGAPGEAPGGLSAPVPGCAGPGVPVLSALRGFRLDSGSGFWKEVCPGSWVRGGEGRCGQSGCGTSPPLLIHPMDAPTCPTGPQEMDDTRLALAAGS